MQLVVPIAIKPFIKKFIEKDFSADPFVVTTNNLYGIFLFTCLEKASPKLLRAEREFALDAGIYSGSLKILISENYWNKYGCIITPQKQYHFNKFVSYQFHEEFYKYVRNRIGAKGSINQAIFDFRDIYGISEDDLSFKTIQRAFQRRHQMITRSLSA